jgi:hypothetical protein
VVVVTQQALYRAEDLLEQARLNSLSATKRLIVDWVSLGLLDQPERRGLGRGKGSVAFWNETQASLFVDLLSLRQRPIDPVRHVAGLTNLPVSGWLWAYPGVPLRQVRRALATWCGQHRTRTSASAGATRRVAREIAKQLDNPHATQHDRQALRQTLEETMRMRTFDAEKVRDAVTRVFDPHGVERALGPRAAPVTVENSVRLLEGHATGFLNLESFSDQEYEDARMIYRQTRREYVADWPALASGRSSPLTFDEPTFENILNGSCRDLILLLGMGRLSPGRRTELAADAEAQEAATETEPRQPANV